MALVFPAAVISDTGFRAVIFYLFIFKKQSADLNIMLTGAELGEAFGCDTLRSYFFPLRPLRLPGWSEC